MKQRNDDIATQSKRKTAYGVIAILLFSVLLSGIVGCMENENLEKKGQNGFMYESEQSGVIMELPEGWEEKCVVKEWEDSIFVFAKSVYESESFPAGGLLFSVERMTGELVADEDMMQSPVGRKIILKGNGYTYIKRLPSDMQYPPDDEEMSEEYEEMLGQIPEVKYELAEGTEKPAAANDGFRVVGGTFFKVEIPEDWEIAEQDLLNWNLKKNGKNIGSIGFVPYDRRTQIHEKESEDAQWIWLHLQSEMLRREAYIMLDSEEVDEVVAGKIHDSFEFVGGPFTVVDLQSNANEYIYRDGEMVFGTIEGFDMDGESPVAVHVNAMEFIPDGPNDENPNGFRIEEKNEIATYPLDFGVRVALLVPPDYNSYGKYDMPMIDEQFIKEHVDYKNFYYNFIVASDGNLKIVLGRYIP